MAGTRGASRPASTARAGGGAVTVLVPGTETGGRFALVQETQVPGGEPPRHLHHWEDETVYVLEGRLEVWAGAERIAAPAGAAVFLPRGAEHTFVVESEQARLLTVLSPSGLEGFYAELNTEGFGSHPDVERLVALAARYGIEITGPRPGRRALP